MIELTWFDTVREEVRVSRLASRSLSIALGNGLPIEAEPEQDSPPPTDAAPEEALTAADRSVFSTTGTVLMSLLLVALLYRAYPWLSKKFSLPKFSLPRLDQKRREQRLRDTIAEGSVLEIRNELDATVRTMERESRPWDRRARDSIYALLSSSAYAPTPADLDREAIASELTRLLSPNKRAHNNHSAEGALPSLYPS